MQRYRPAQSGFAIIEVLVSLTLLAAVYLVLTHAYLTALSVTNRGGRVTTATALVAKKLEEVRTRVEATIDPNAVAACLLRQHHRRGDHSLPAAPRGIHL